MEQGPHSALAPHFHRKNEFQVVVQGGGHFGAHAVQAITVHYAGAYTGHGPVVAGDEGLSYFTILSVFEQGAAFLPQGRDQMVRGPKRQFHSPPYPAADAQALAARRDAETLELIPPQPDGIGATRAICKALQIAPSGYWRHAALLREPEKRCVRARHDEGLCRRSNASGRPT